MPQLRQNIVTGEWVVIAPERAKRASDFIVPQQANNQARENCPFCLGSEAHAGRYQNLDRPNSYIIQNKFPAFIGRGEHEVRTYAPEKSHFYRAKPAAGGHDVVIFKNHEANIFTLNQETLVNMFESFRVRYEYYREDPTVEYVMAIYNHGANAAASINHPHAQILASSVIPNYVLKEKHGSERYLETNGSCVYCDMITHERSEGVRLLVENENFMAFTFFAARFPFEIWILPKSHQSTFESITPNQIEHLATLFHSALAMLNQRLVNPALNFYIHSLPTTSEAADYYHWHLEIAPRLTKYGGYELGGGMIIDVISPEQAAESLLNAKKNDGYT